MISEDNPQILIVDDQKGARTLLERLLSGRGYDLIFASNGAEALAKAAKLTPDLVLLDVMMPRMDGFEVCRRLRADPDLAEVPVVMLTALDDYPSRLQGLEVGANDFLTKPVDGIELRARVRTNTQLSYQRRLRILELQAERDRTQSILEALGEAVVVTDTAGIIQYVNPAAITLTGFTREELLGQNWSLLQGEQQPSDFYTNIKDTVRSGQTWQGEVRPKRKDATQYDTMLTVAPLFDRHNVNRPIGFVSVQRDITFLKEAERLKDKFVSNVTHELSTPLSTIIFLADNLDTLYKDLSEEKRRKMIRDVQKHAQVLDNLIDGVLKVSRLDGNRISPERQEVNLFQLTREEIDEQLFLAQRKNQTVRITGVEPLLVWGNDGQLRQIIRNLLHNAIKYTPNGGQITCESTLLTTPMMSEARVGKVWPGKSDLPVGSWAALRIVDNGPGISQEDLPHLFKRFYRVKTQSNIRGAGLGLSIAQELIELHSGRMAVTSMLCEGTIFAIYVPQHGATL